jgi:hypothetical protein
MAIFHVFPQFGPELRRRGSDLTMIIKRQKFSKWNQFGPDILTCHFSGYLNDQLEKRISFQTLTQFLGLQEFLSCSTAVIFVHELQIRCNYSFGIYLEDAYTASYKPFNKI